jgi:hypothetical protein
MIAVLEISFTGILELYFYDILFFSIPRDVCQPIVSVQLLVLMTASFAA